ncbi:MAG: hypothetical protein WCL00_16065, partial [Bacteroidota bacterium]
MDAGDSGDALGATSSCQVYWFFFLNCSENYLNQNYFAIKVETTTFILERKKFHAELVSIKKLTPKFFKSGIALINVLPEQIELHTVGITKYFSAQTEGYVDVFVPLRLLFAYASTMSTSELKFEVKQGEIQCGSSIFSSPDIKIRFIFNADNGILPLNASEFDLLRYAYKASESELANFGLTKNVEKAQARLTERLSQA